MNRGGGQHALRVDRTTCMQLKASVEKGSVWLPCSVRAREEWVTGEEDTSTILGAAYSWTLYFRRAPLWFLLGVPLLLVRNQEGVPWPLLNTKIRIWNFLPKWPWACVQDVCEPLPRSFLPALPFPPTLCPSVDQKAAVSVWGEGVLVVLGVCTGNQGPANGRGGSEGHYSSTDFWHISPFIIHLLLSQAGW